MSKGRPKKSIIRDNMVEILFFMQEAYGYELFKKYRAIYPAITLRSIYYHLKKGCELGVFKKLRVESDKGDYSWGRSSERIVYSLGPNANPKGDKRVAKYLQKNQTGKQ